MSKLIPLDINAFLLKLLLKQQNIGRNADVYCSKLQTKFIEEFQNKKTLLETVSCFLTVKKCQNEMIPLSGRLKVQLWAK